MKPFHTALSFLIFAATLGIQAQIVHATETREVLKAEQGHQLFSLGKYLITAMLRSTRWLQVTTRAAPSLVTEQKKVMRVVEDAIQKFQEDQDGSLVFPQDTPFLCTKSANWGQKSPIGFQDSSDCCLSYTSRVHCSRYKNYFPTSGGCTKPAIIFVSKKGTLVCANPSDLRVQKCIKRLEQNSQPQIYKQ